MDKQKRKTLTLLGTTAAAAVLPAVAIAGHQQPATPSTGAGPKQCMDLRLELTVAQQPTLRLSNDTDQPALVSHIYPGIAHAGQHTFNLNALFANGAHRIGPGQSITLPIQPQVGRPATETPFPRHRYKHQPQRIARLRGADANGALINSTRSFYS